MHACFKINNTAFTEKTFAGFIEKLLFSNAIHLQEVGAFLSEWQNEKNYIVINTSGSTGVPKEVKLLKEHMKNSAIATGDYFNLKENTTALLCLSANYIAGKMMLVRAIVLGWNIHIQPPNSSPLENNQKYDFAAMVPMQVSNSLPYLNNIKQLIIGGAPISETLQQQLQLVTTDCFMTYGMTETCTHIAIKPLNKTHTDVFETLPNVKVLQDDRDCLVIKASKISDGLITTNDIVKLHSDTSFQWIGRFDSIVNSGGVKLFPEQIEQKLSKYIKARFFVTGIPDTILGEKLILVVESETAVVLDKTELENSLLKYEVPKNFFFSPKFKETPTGKIHRSETLKSLNL